MQTADLLSVHDVAIRLSAAEDTVVGWAQDGTLPAQMIDGAYWFRPADVAAYADAHPDPDPPGDGAVNNLIRPPQDAPTRSNDDR